MRRNISIGKRYGQVYSLTAVLISVPVILFIILYLTTVQTIKSDVTDLIVSDQLNQLSRGLEKDFGRAVEISGRRAVLDATNTVVTNGTYLTDSTAATEELLNNGTLNGNVSTIMFNNTIKDWVNRVMGIVTKYNIYLNNSYITISNYDGFNIQGRSILTINVSDQFNKIRIDNTFEKSILIPVTGFEDPLLLLSTNGKVSRLIKKYPYPLYTKNIVSGSTRVGNCTGPVAFGGPADPNKILVNVSVGGVSGWKGVVGETADIPAVPCYQVGAVNAVSLINSTINEINYSEIYLDQSTGVWSLPINDGITKWYYYQSSGSSGPTILERLEGKAVASTNGLESFINIPDMQAAGVSTAGKEDNSMVDYLYFSDVSGPCSIRGLPSWFRIDTANRDKYNLTELAYDC